MGLDPMDHVDPALLHSGTLDRPCHRPAHGCPGRFDSRARTLSPTATDQLIRCSSGSMPGRTSSIAVREPVIRRGSQAMAKGFKANERAIRSIAQRSQTSSPRTQSGPARGRSEHVHAAFSNDRVRPSQHSRHRPCRIGLHRDQSVVLTVIAWTGHESSASRSASRRLADGDGSMTWTGPDAGSSKTSGT